MSLSIDNQDMDYACQPQHPFHIPLGIIQNMPIEKYTYFNI